LELATNYKAVHTNASSGRSLNRGFTRGSLKRFTRTDN